MRLTLDGLLSALREQAGRMADDVDPRYGRGQAAIEPASAPRFADTRRTGRDDLSGG